MNNHETVLNKIYSLRLQLVSKRVGIQTGWCLEGMVSRQVL
jgi:hypothetical protein